MIHISFHVQRGIAKKATQNLKVMVLNNIPIALKPATCAWCVYTEAFSIESSSSDDIHDVGFTEYAELELELLGVTGDTTDV